MGKNGIEHKLVRKDEDFAFILPLIVDFSYRTGVNPLWYNMQEVCQAFNSDQTIFVYAKYADTIYEKGKAISYVGGYFIKPKMFLITQALSKDPKLTEIGFSILEREAVERGARELLCHVRFHPRTLKKYGFNFHSYLLNKPVGEEVY